jgi:hypothetical protein|tara:strand:- start:27 stop:290 length:264 start_codon:yes stop_codon:yes gene_type:complete
MKIFFYKSLLIFFLSFILIQFTINLALKDFKEQIYELRSKKNIEAMKNKIRKEIKNGIQSENYLSDDDAQLINDFFKKIQKELDNQK